MSEEESSTESSSSESSSESDEDLIQDIPDRDFFKTLSYLKNKDPRIYDDKVQFFTEPPIIIKNKSKNDDIKTHVEQNSSDSIQESGATETKTNKPTSNKFSLKDFENDSSSEDELVSLKKQSADPPKVENEVQNECIQFLKGNKKELEDKQFEHDLKPLKKYWNTESLDENEQFLKDYILNKKYLAADSELNENENLSEDERELEEQAEYEANYNFRFENENNLQLKRFPRNVEGSMRKKNDARSKKRAEIAQRKKEEKAKKYQDVKKKQKEKLSEIEERLQKLKELTGNVELGFKDEEILEDFDPEKHDQKMKELFNEDYYNKEDYEHPVFNEDDEDWQNYDLEMDNEGNVEETKKLTRTQRKKLRKKKTYRDVMDLAKPSFDPKVHNDFKKYIDEFYSLDCEDFIDDIPCKFKYREVVPNDYGLSVEEILMADDNELNRWASVKKCWKRRPEHVEKNEVKVYQKKAQDEALKRTILKSLYTPPEELERSNAATQDIDKSVKDKRKRKYSDSLQETEDKKELDELQPKQDFDHFSEEDGAIENDEETKSLVKHSKKKNKKMKPELIVNNEYISENNSEVEHKKRKKNNQQFENSPSSLQDEDEVKKSVEQTTDNSNISGSKINGVSNEQSNNTSNLKKKKRRKKKKNKSVSGETTTNEGSQNKTEEPAKHQNVTQPVHNIAVGKKNKRKRDSRGSETGKVKNKFNNKFGFKKKNSVVNLSDSRLQAYGIKPKQFRAKMKFSQKNTI